MKPSPSPASLSSPNASTSTTTTNTTDKLSGKKSATEFSSSYSSSSPFSFFYSIMPKEILGVPVVEIKKDLVDGRSQISSLWETWIFLLLLLLLLEWLKNHEKVKILVFL